MAKKLPLCLTLSMCLIGTNTFAVDLISADKNGEAGAKSSMTSAAPQYFSSASVSKNGRYVSFSGNGTEIVDGIDGINRDGASNVFRHDLVTKETIAISVPNTNASTEESDRRSESSSISDDGRYITFESTSRNLTLDTPTSRPRQDIFYYDATNTAEPLTLVTKGTGSGDSLTPAISGDGKLIAYSSERDDLNGANISSTQRQIFLYDIASGTNEVLSRADGPNGSIGNRKSDFVSLSEDGHYAVFKSAANNLFGTGHNGGVNIFLRDTQNNTTILISKHWATGAYPAYNSNPSIASNTYESGVGGGGGGTYFAVPLGPLGMNTFVEEADNAIDDSGNYIVYHSYSTELVESDDNDAISDIFLYNVSKGEAIKITGTDYTIDGNTANGNSILPTISDNGRYIAFVSEADNLVEGDTNGQADIFRYDRIAKTITRVNVNENNEELNSFSSFPREVMNNGYVFYSSVATNVIAAANSVGGADLYLSTPAALRNSGNAQSIPSSTPLTLLGLVVLLLSSVGLIRRKR